MNAGTADNDIYTLGVYGSYFGESGAFIDMMAKIGRIDTEYDLSNGITESGDYMMTGAIVGIEAGHRFDINNFYVEPQVQLTYSWLRASDYSTSVRTVEFDNMRSLVARVGVMGGVKFNENRGAAYVKASYNHDFLGDVDASFASFDGRMSRSIEDELDDNWGEVSVCDLQPDRCPACVPRRGHGLWRRHRPEVARELRRTLHVLNAAV